MYQLSHIHFCEAGPSSYMDRPHLHSHHLDQSHLERTIGASYERPAITYSLQAGVYASLPSSYSQRTFSFHRNSFAPEGMGITACAYEGRNEEKKSTPLSDMSYGIGAQPQLEYHFDPDEFLRPGREGIFVGDAAQIREHIEKAFELLLGQPFPAGIKISVCNEQQFRALAPYPGTIGFSLNRHRQGLLSEIFVLNDSLARVMLTIGHELGHVLSEPLGNHFDEEAKAYAFSRAWMKIIKKHNIANLREAIVTEIPAENGLHNVAFFFVEKLLRQRKNAWGIYHEIVTGILSVPLAIC